MATIPIPAGPNDITAAWLTSALRETGVLKNATVTAFDTEVIGEGAGLIGQLAKVRLQYDRPEPGAPASLIAKFPAATPENREIGNIFRFYEREIRFYEELSHRVPVRVPRRYYSAMDLERGEFVLLLEDLSGLRLGDQLASCTPEEAATAVRALGKLHAAFWQKPELERLDWMPYTNDPVQKSAQDSYARAWQPFVDNFGHQVPPATLRTAERLGAPICDILDRFVDPPRTIIHGDFRLDNLFFGHGKDGDPLAIIDWQIASRGRGAFDIAYFFSGSLSTEARRACERGVLREYHEILQREGGATDYTWDEFFRDYRMGALFCMVYSVITCGSLDLANERGMALGSTILKRNVDAIADLDCDELLSQI
ncbi:MAG: ecdysteroid 22-kinase family protein [Dehalococcoidia bacterium]|nr:ecdysteroid 22-kinase family protein [Dehalococcoidia bacterium]